MLIAIGRNAATPFMVEMELSAANPLVIKEDNEKLVPLFKCFQLLTNTPYSATPVFLPQALQLEYSFPFHGA